MSDFESEKREYDLVIGRGVSFDVEQTFFKRRPTFWGRFQKPIKKTETVKYTLKEPTLAILDLISLEQIELKLDEKVMSSEIGMNEAKRLTSEHCKRMAKIVALAVLGQDYIIPIQHGAGYQYKYDDKRLEELTDIFFTFVKPSKLLQLTLLINTIENLGDFINSIRLMSANRTMMPIRIEEKQED